MDDEKPKHNIPADVTVAMVALLLGLAILGTYFNTLAEWYYAAVDWLYSQETGSTHRLFMIVFIALDALLLGIIILSIILHNRLVKIKPREIKEEEPVAISDEAARGWEEIKALANSENKSDWNMAVMRADALLDDVLMHLGYEGTTMAERLKIVDPTQLPSLDKVWSSHRLRNMIAHDPLEQHTRETIVHALRSYEQALKELGVLEKTT